MTSAVPSVSTRHHLPTDPASPHATAATQESPGEPGDSDSGTRRGESYAFTLPGSVAPLNVSTHDDHRLPVCVPVLSHSL